MCRIAGIIDFKEPEKLQHINAMRDAMFRGGPDDAGSYLDADWPLAIAMRRLALVDLSDAGHQPMSVANEQIWIVFNGEIYNFKEIKLELEAKGYQFKSGTDTEVILNAWEEWNTQCFDKFNGMFGLCIWDKRTNQLILARDHAGMKPLYYYVNENDKQLYFASEIRAFKQLDNNWPEDPHWKVYFLAYGFIPEPGTTLANVRMLPKGHFLVVDIAAFTCCIQQWQPKNTSYVHTNIQQATKALQQTLEAAVKRHLVADAPIGLFLSGGVDSSLLTLLAAKNIPAENLYTVSLTFEEAAFNEQPYQQQIAALTGSKHFSHTITRQEFEESLPDIIEALDMPSNDGINAYFISKYARKAGLTAVLSGVGADELFGGYGSFGRRKKIRQLLKLPAGLLALAAQIPGDKIKRLAYLQYPGLQAEYLLYRGFYLPEQIAWLLNMQLTEVKDILFEKSFAIQINTASDKEYISELEQDFYMKNQLLRDLDCMSMWHSLEVRMPFLDRTLIDLCNQTLPAIRFGNGSSKKWLIESFKHLLPTEIWNRKKMGFTFPFHIWLRKLHIAGAVDDRLFRIRKSFLTGSLHWSRYWVYLQSLQQPILFKTPGRKILFITLTGFSKKGGIEKFNSQFAKALWLNAQQYGWQTTVVSAYDTVPDVKCFPGHGFKGFNKNKRALTQWLLTNINEYNIVIAGHVNLAPLVWLCKKVNHSARYVFIAHGIEVWQPLSALKSIVLQQCSRVWCVSHFTASQLQINHKLSSNKLPVFHNTVGDTSDDSSYLGIDFFQAYNIAETDKLLLTIARLSSNEKYKGYDKVLQCLPSLIANHPSIKYLIAGSADEEEQKRVEQLIADLNLQQQVILTSFVADEYLPVLYKRADAFVMPSSGEGFGIVFIEAAWHGAQVVAGNKDGSVDALLNGQLGKLVDPENQLELEAAISEVLEKPIDNEEKKYRRQLVETYFGFDRFRQRQSDLLNGQFTNE